MSDSVDTRISELCSGIDALYFSIRCNISQESLARLEEHRCEAERLGGFAPIDVGGMLWDISSFGRRGYPYRLRCEGADVLVGPGESLPALYVQPRSLWLHGLGPRRTLDLLVGRLTDEFGEGKVSLSRIDLFLDVQGWSPVPEDLARFVRRARQAREHWDGETFTGFNFGSRGSRTVYARIYDKSQEAEDPKSGYWKEIWGDQRDPDLPVWRVEFELNRRALTEFGVQSPDDAFHVIDRLWAACTEWLSLRLPTEDATHSRWPVDPVWEAIQHASIGLNATPLERLRERKLRLSSDRCMDQIWSVMVRLGAILDKHDWTSLMARLDTLPWTKRAELVAEFADRVALKRGEMGLRHE